MIDRLRRFLATALTLVLVLIWSAPADANDKAAAESLFRAGKALMDGGNFAEACLKFEESHEAEPSVGALLNLALCNQEQGKIASAWAYYGEAAVMAGKLQDDQRREGAEKLKAELEPRLSYLTVEVAQEVDGLEVTRGGVRVPSFGAALPVDPGTHQISAKAPGHEPWAGSVTIAGEGDRQSITVPALVAKPAGAADDEAGEGGMAWQSIVGWSLIGLGAVGVTVGVITGAMATSNKGELDDACNNNTCTRQEDIDKLESTRTLATVSTVGIAVGAVAAVGGVVLLLLAPADTVTVEGGDVAFEPVIGPRGGGLTITGRF